MSKRRISYFLHPSNSGGAGDDIPPGAPGSAAGGRSGISRRVFLVRSSLVAGTAAVVGSVPGFTSILSSAESDSPEIGGAAPEAAGAAEAGAVPGTRPTPGRPCRQCQYRRIKPVPGYRTDRGQEPWIGPGYCPVGCLQGLNPPFLRPFLLTTLISREVSFVFSS